jgi:hypothetical protein
MSTRVDEVRCTMKRDVQVLRPEIARESLKTGGLEIPCDANPFRYLVLTEHFVDVDIGSDMKIRSISFKPPVTQPITEAHYVKDEWCVFRFNGSYSSIHVERVVHETDKVSSSNIRVIIPEDLIGKNLCDVFRHVSTTEMMSKYIREIRVNEVHIHDLEKKMTYSSLAIARMAVALSHSTEESDALFKQYKDTLIEFEKFDHEYDSESRRIAKLKDTTKKFYVSRGGDPSGIF